jgi:uncharacterized DUF497 family protein
MDFEFDPVKSDANKNKHGIDSMDAQALWNDPDLLEIPANTTDEPRFLVVGKIGEKHWSGCNAIRNIVMSSSRRVITDPDGKKKIIRTSHFHCEIRRSDAFV